VPRLRSILILCLAFLAIVPASASATAPRAFRHLGTWVDIFDTAVLNSPTAPVAYMKQKNVHTIYVETANATSARFVHVKGVGKLLEAAHNRGIRVVAWTLPGHYRPTDDRKKAMAAIRFRSPRGDRFDGFALDIESTHVKSIRTRNSRLLALSRQIKNRAGTTPLGAITYSPVFINGPWPHFPWKPLAKLYRTFFPMAYSSYHYDSRAAVRRYTQRSVNLLRDYTSQHKSIHVIGGIADKMRPSETQGFVRGIKNSNVAGGSLYDYMTSNGGDWKWLKTLP
jgi:hypothetical protein